MAWLRSRTLSFSDLRTPRLLAARVVQLELQPIEAASLCRSDALLHARLTCACITINSRVIYSLASI